MKRKINLSFCLLCSLTVLLTALVITTLLYNDYSQSIKDDLRKEADYIAVASNTEPDYPAKILHTATDRITLISGDGTVLLDSDADPAELGSHAKRPEFIAAKETGYGESTRVSDTLAQKTYYCAVRLANGSVLRVGRTTDSILSSYLSALPWLLLCAAVTLLLSIAISALLTRRIVEPINRINLENAQDVPYDELAPLLERIRAQKKEINTQMEELNKKEQEFSSLSDNMREGFIMLNYRCEVLAANRSACRILSIQNADIKGRNLLELSRDPELARLAPAACGGKKGSMALVMEGRTYKVHVCPVSGGGAVLLMLDATEEIARERLRQEFSANVSHELKTPLTVISGYAELLKSGQADSASVELFSEKIYSEAARLIALVEDIIQLSYLDENRTLPRTEPVELLSLAKDVAESLEPKCRLRNIHFSVTGTPVTVQGIRPLMREMVYNICENAVKYNVDGGSVTVTVSDTGQDIRLEVKDTGIGIPERDLERVFERFYRVDKSRSKASGGTGLGLSIVKHAAAVLRARVKLSSVLGKGTTAAVIFQRPESK